MGLKRISGHHKKWAISTERTILGSLRCHVRNSALQYTPLNDQTVLFQISKKKQKTQVICLHPVYMSNTFIWPLRYDPIKFYFSASKWTWEQWQWRGTPHSTKLQHNWSLTIRFLVLQKEHSLEGSYSLASMQSVYSTGPPDYALYICKWIQTINVIQQALSKHF